MPNGPPWLANDLDPGNSASSSSANGVKPLDLPYEDAEGTIVPVGRPLHPTALAHSSTLSNILVHDPTHQQITNQPRNALTNQTFPQPAFDGESARSSTSTTSAAPDNYGVLPLFSMAIQPDNTLSASFRNVSSMAGARMCYGMEQNGITIVKLSLPRN